MHLKYNTGPKMNVSLLIETIQDMPVLSVEDLDAVARLSLEAPERWANYVGIPYTPAGRSIERDKGLDCWGLLRLVYLNLYDLDIGLYYKVEFDKWLSLDPSKHTIREGDAVVFNIARMPLHVGVVTDPAKGLMLNTRLSTRASIIEQYSYSSWAKRLNGFYRHSLSEITS